MELLEADVAITVSIFGFFAFVWFGWAQERPPSQRTRWWLAGGAVAGLLLSVFGGIRTGAAEDDPSLYEGGAMGLFYIVVGLEFGLAALGAIILVIVRRQEFIAPWICLVVGVHFFPLAPLLDNAALYVLAALLTVWPFVAVRVAQRRDLSTSFMTGVGAGSCLLFFALLSTVGLLLAGA